MPTVRVDREPAFKLSMTVDFFGDGGRGLYTSFFHLARATPDGCRLVPVQDRMRRIRRKARELRLVGN